MTISFLHEADQRMFSHQSTFTHTAPVLHDFFLAFYSVTCLFVCSFTLRSLLAMKSCFLLLNLRMTQQICITNRDGSLCRLRIVPETAVRSTARSGDGFANYGTFLRTSGGRRRGWPCGRRGSYEYGTFRRWDSELRNVPEMGFPTSECSGEEVSCAV